MISLSKDDKCRLLEDILSGNYTNRGKQIPYGHQGEAVTIVEMHDEVAIVQDGVGIRFSVHISKLKKV